MGKDAKTDGRVKYTDEFKERLSKCVAKGLSVQECAEELDIDSFGSGFRQLYYRIKRDQNDGVEVKTLKGSGGENPANSVGTRVKIVNEVSTHQTVRPLKNIKNYTGESLIKQSLPLQLKTEEKVKKAKAATGQKSNKSGKKIETKPTISEDKEHVTSVESAMLQSEAEVTQSDSASVENIMDENVSVPIEARVENTSVLTNMREEESIHTEDTSVAEHSQSVKEVSEDAESVKVQPTDEVLKSEEQLTDKDKISEVDALGVKDVEGDLKAEPNKEEERGTEEAKKENQKSFKVSKDKFRALFDYFAMERQSIMREIERKEKELSSLKSKLALIDSNSEWLKSILNNKE